MWENVNSFKKWKECAEEQGFRCFYCGFDFLSSPQAYASVVQEHFKPRSEGGTKIVLACPLCNIVKDTMTFESPEEARTELARLREEYLKKYEFEELRKKYRK